MRKTIRRDWTPGERDLAALIVDAVYLGEGRLVGRLSVIRAVGLPYASHHERRRSEAKVADVMPLAVMLAPIMYPGLGLVVNRDRTYVLTDQPDLLKIDTITRVKKVRTMIDRACAVAAPLGTRHDLGSVVLVNQLGMMTSALSPDVWDAIVAEMERVADDGTATP